MSDLRHLSRLQTGEPFDPDEWSALEEELRTERGWTEPQIEWARRMCLAYDDAVDAEFAAHAAGDTDAVHTAERRQRELLEAASELRGRPL